MFGLPPIRDIKRLRESLTSALGRSRPDWNRQLTERFRQTQNGMVAVFHFGHPMPCILLFSLSLRSALLKPLT